MVVFFFCQAIEKNQDFRTHQPWSAVNVKNLVTQAFRRGMYIYIWDCLKIVYTPNDSHLIGIMIMNHWL